MAPLLIGLTPSAFAQMPSHVQFEHGKDHTVLSGAIVGREYHYFLLHARSGQTMTAKLPVTDTNGDGTPSSTSCPPGAMTSPFSTARRAKTGQVP
jgi:hypothetical protein